MAKLYIKNTDGTFTPYSPIAVTNLDIVQSKGDSLTSVMSQKSVSDELTKKQDTVADLDTIRQGAEKGSTALQSESDHIYTADKPNIALKSELDGKVDKEKGKGLSSNDYTDAEKAKLAGLENYDDAQIKALITGKANKATTLAGYGITNAYTKSEVDAAIATAITTTLNTEV